ncbi:hypothetical protein [Saccharopolyspora phatthalungensis]|uniref:Putative membrane-anchored protein n=1 Tax=Saccharopolyspora phatthalungensis TaxID=664693 RepID=A0A840QI53_9PSEU|nr:hypothetical protein [Saccharopolyspora phatthalungensis]MBB5159907.1 putative membrane-anchored protein [Saccharopolyspora phatthalungensis]
MLPTGLAQAVVVLVCAVWAANFVAPFFVPGYVSDPQLNLVFMSIVGGALALSRSRRRDGDQ